jgi:hypothetical protein
MAPVEITGYKAALSRLDRLKKRMMEPGPAIQQIAMMFSVMQAQRFSNGGAAPEFGVTKWPEIQESTLERRRYNPGTNPDSPSLVQRGYLRLANVSPTYSSFDLFSNELTIKIDPKGGKWYGGGGKGYAEALMQKGFKFVEITPIFRKMANEIVDRYLMGEDINDYEEDKDPAVIDEGSNKRYRNSKGGKRGAGKRSMREQSSTERNMESFKSLPQDRQSFEYAKWKTNGRMHWNTSEFKSARDQYNETRIVNTLYSKYQDTGERSAVIDWSSFGTESEYRQSLSSVRRFFSSVRDGKL